MLNISQNQIPITDVSNNSRCMSIRFSYIYDMWDYIRKHLCLYITSDLTSWRNHFHPTMQTSATSKLLVSDIASSVDHVPSSYIRPISDRPNLHDVDISSNSIPLIDLQELHGPKRANIIYQLEHACSSYGFFQVTPSLFHFHSRSDWLCSTGIYCSIAMLYFVSNLLHFLSSLHCLYGSTLLLSLLFTLFYNMRHIEF